MKYLLKTSNKLQQELKINMLLLKECFIIRPIRSVNLV